MRRRNDREGDRPGATSSKSPSSLRPLGGKVKELKKKGDVLIISIHWGKNWGYEVPSEQREFAQRLIDDAGVDIIHGHSSHHVKGIEVYREKLIIYGCGDFINDYEGIVKYKEFTGCCPNEFFSYSSALVSQRLGNE